MASASLGPASSTFPGRTVSGVPRRIQRPDRLALGRSAHWAPAALGLKSVRCRLAGADHSPAACASAMVGRPLGGAAATPAELVPPDLAAALSAGNAPDQRAWPGAVPASNGSCAQCDCHFATSQVFPLGVLMPWDERSELAPACLGSVYIEFVRCPAKSTPCCSSQNILVSNAARRLATGSAGGRLGSPLLRPYVAEARPAGLPYPSPASRGRSLPALTCAKPLSRWLPQALVPPAGHGGSSSPFCRQPRAFPYRLLEMPANRRTPSEWPNPDSCSPPSVPPAAVFWFSAPALGSQPGPWNGTAFDPPIRPPEPPDTPLHQLKRRPSATGPWMIERSAQKRSSNGFFHAPARVDPASRRGEWW